MHWRERTSNIGCRPCFALWGLALYVRTYRAGRDVNSPGIVESVSQRRERTDCN